MVDKDDFSDTHPSQQARGQKVSVAMDGGGEKGGGGDEGTRDEGGAGGSVGEEEKPFNGLSQGKSNRTYFTSMFQSFPTFPLSPPLSSPLSATLAPASLLVAAAAAAALGALVFVVRPVLLFLGGSM